MLLRTRRTPHRFVRLVAVVQHEGEPSGLTLGRSDTSLNTPIYGRVSLMYARGERRWSQEARIWLGTLKRSARWLTRSLGSTVNARLRSR